MASSGYYDPFYGTHDMVPVFTKYCEKSHGEEGAEDVEAALHHGRDKFGNGRHAHEDDGHEGQDHVDALSQEDLGVHGVCLQSLLLLLVQLQLGDARLAGLEGLLRARGRAGSDAGGLRGCGGAHARTGTKAPAQEAQGQGRSQQPS